jgi:tetratricopeptide (TPR) repeat protein
VHWHSAGRPDWAEAAYHEALALRERLAAEFPEKLAFRRDLAQTLHSQGNLLKDAGRPAEAEAAYLRALELRKKLHDARPADRDHRENLAWTVFQLGRLYHDTGRPTKAEPLYREAIAVREKLVADAADVPRYRQQLAQNLHNLGNLLKDAGRLADAETAYQRALDLRRKLVGAKPKDPDYRTEVAWTQNQLGHLWEANGAWEKAEGAFREAVALRERLAQESPDNATRGQQLAEGLNSLGYALERQKRFTAAVPCYQRAVDGWRTLLASGPGKDKPYYRQECARAYTNLVNTYRAMNRQEDGIPVLREVIRLREQLATDRPKDFDTRGYLADNLRLLAGLLQDRGLTNEAVSIRRRAVQVRAGLNRDNPFALSFTENLASERVLLVQALVEADQLDEAKKVLVDAVPAAERLVQGHPAQTTYQAQLAYLLARRALVRLNRGKGDEAMPDLERALAYQKKLYEADRANTERSSALGAVYLLLGEAHLQGKRHADAARAAHELSGLTVNGWNARVKAAALLARSIPLAEADPAKPEAERKQTAGRYRDEALQHLRAARNAGFRDTGALESGPEFGPLKTDAEFQKLLKDLTADRKEK